MSKMKTSEHALAIIKAGLSLHPIGGVVASLLGDYLPSATDRAVKEFTAEFEKRLAALENRLDSELVGTDDFLELFKSSFLIVMRSHKQARLKAAALLLSNALLKEGDTEKLSYTELDHFVRALDSLSIGALNLLAKLTPPRGGTHLQPRRRHDRVNFDQLAAPNAFGDAQLLMGLARELEAFSLVEIAIPQIRTENFGNCAIILTDLGLRFSFVVLDNQLGG